MLTIAICDDEPIHRELVKDALAKYQILNGLDYSTLEFPTAKALREAPFTYDILFLDVMLDNGEDGIALGRELKNRHNPAVFILVTSLATRYADGYFAQAIRYLEKPIDPEKFEEAMRAALTSLETQSVTVTLCTKTDCYTVRLDDLCYIETVKHRKRVYLQGTAMPFLDLWCGWDELLSILPKNQFHFIRRGCLVNLANIKALKEGFVVLSDNTELKLSAARRNELVRKYCAQEDA